MATVLTNLGKAIVTARMRGTGTEPLKAAWGTGGGTAAITDTALFTEASEARITGTSSQVTITVTNDTYQVVATIVADGTKTITNAGLFDAATLGNLFLKGDFTGVPLLVGDSITFTFKVKFT